MKNSSSPFLAMLRLRKLQKLAIFATLVVPQMGCSLGNPLSASPTPSDSPAVDVDLSDAAADSTPPSVIAFTPGSDSTGSSPSTTVVATLSEAVLPSSCTSGILALIGVAGALSCDTNAVAFAPTLPLGVYTTYNATLDAGLQDLAGNALNGATSWSFSTGDASWSTGTAIDTGDWDAGLGTESSGVAMNSSGVAIAVWSQFIDSSDAQIFARIRTSGSTWGAALSIDPTGEERAEYPSVELDENGNALVIWKEGTGSGTQVWVSRYTAATGWGTAEMLSAQAGALCVPTLKMDLNGNAIALYSEVNSGGGYDIHARYFTEASAAWSAASVIATEANSISQAPRLAMSANGSAIAVWVNSSNNIYGNVFSSGSWGTPALLETLGAAASLPDVAMDANGNGVAAWAQGGNALAANYTSGGGWGAAGNIETRTGAASDVRVSMNSGGTAVAAWNQVNGTSTQIFSNRMVSGTWGTASAISSGTFDIGSRVALDDAGNALVIWNQVGDGAPAIVANRYVSHSSAWGTATEVSAEVESLSLGLALSREKGVGVAVWNYGNAVTGYDAGAAFFQ